MEPPEKVQIGVFSMDVRVDPEKLAKEGADRGENLAGLSSLEDQEITLGKHPYDYTADTLLHEVLHTCLRAAACNINDEVDGSNVDDVEERVVNAMTGILLDTLRRNPKMVRYLLKGQ